MTLIDLKKSFIDVIRSSKPEDWDHARDSYAYAARRLARAYVRATGSKDGVVEAFRDAIRETEAPVREFFSNYDLTEERIAKEVKGAIRNL